VNVRDEPYLAFGDGSHDDTQAIQAALDSALFHPRAHQQLGSAEYVPETCLDDKNGSSCADAYEIFNIDGKKGSFKNRFNPQVVYYSGWTPALSFVTGLRGVIVYFPPGVYRISSPLRPPAWGPYSSGSPNVSQFVIRLSPAATIVFGGRSAGLSKPPPIPEPIAAFVITRNSGHGTLLIEGGRLTRDRLEGASNKGAKVTGILIQPVQPMGSKVVVRDIQIDGFDGDGIRVVPRLEGEFSYDPLAYFHKWPSQKAFTAEECRIENCSILRNIGNGVVSAAGVLVVDRCRIAENAGIGVYSSAPITRVVGCSLKNNGPVKVDSAAWDDVKKTTGVFIEAFGGQAPTVTGNQILYDRSPTSDCSGVRAQGGESALRSLILAANTMSCGPETTGSHGPTDGGGTCAEFGSKGAAWNVSAFGNLLQRGRIGIRVSPYSSWHQVFANRGLMPTAVYDRSMNPGSWTIDQGHWSRITLGRYATRFVLPVRSSKTGVGGSGSAVTQRSDGPVAHGRIVPLSLLTTGTEGILILTNLTSGSSAVFEIASSFKVTTLVEDPDGAFSVAKPPSNQTIPTNRIHVYYRESIGGVSEQHVLENRTGVPVKCSAFFLGMQ
jgi:hypothetical protein